MIKMDFTGKTCIRVGSIFAAINPANGRIFPL